MPKIKCDQCGNTYDGYKAKKCPKCGDPFDNEMKRKIRKSINLRKGQIKTIIIIGIVVLSGCLIAEYSQRFYSWDEWKYSDIADKQMHTHTQTSGGKNPTISTYHDYHFYLEDGYEEKVDEHTYNSWKVGEQYLYKVVHTDWKPGMKDAPIPIWVFIIPFIVIIPIVIYYYREVYRRRKVEFNEWLETGDITVEGSEQE